MLVVFVPSLETRPNRKESPIHSSFPSSLLDVQVLSMPASLECTCVKLSSWLMYEHLNWIVLDSCRRSSRFSSFSPQTPSSSAGYSRYPPDVANARILGVGLVSSVPGFHFYFPGGLTMRPQFPRPDASAYGTRFDSPSEAERTWIYVRELPFPLHSSPPITHRAPSHAISATRRTLHFIQKVPPPLSQGVEEHQE